jgi:pimeloyl-ACP methyl ester carboxylesterase
VAAEQQPGEIWYAATGSGDPLVLLHPGGAGVDARALTPQVTELSSMFEVFTPEQRAHGHTPDIEGPLSYQSMARDTVAFVTATIGGPVHLVGYSDGAVVALTIAAHQPDLVRRLVLVAGVFHRDGWHDGVLDRDPPEQLRRSYAQLSPDGHEHYDTVVEKLDAMHAREPSFSSQNLSHIMNRTLVMVADDDEVRLEHAIELYRSLPDAELAVIPGTSHGLLAEKPDLCNLLIARFLNDDPAPTYAPIRRARST